MLASMALAIALVAPTQTSDACAYLAGRFQPPADRAEIKRLLDRLLPMYGEPTADESYLKAGAMLITIRKRDEIREMDLLRYMSRHPLQGVKSFQQAAFLSMAAYRVDYPSIPRR